MHDDRDLTPAEPASGPDRPRFMSSAYRNFGALVELTYTPRFLLGKRVLPAALETPPASQEPSA